MGRERRGRLVFVGRDFVELDCKRNAGWPVPSRTIDFLPNTGSGLGSFPLAVQSRVGWSVLNKNPFRISGGIGFGFCVDHLVDQIVAGREVPFHDPYPSCVPFGLLPLEPIFFEFLESCFLLRRGEVRLGFFSNGLPLMSAKRRPAVEVFDREWIVFVIMALSASGCGGQPNVSEVAHPVGLVDGDVFVRLGAAFLRGL